VLFNTPALTNIRRRNLTGNRSQNKDAVGMAATTGGPLLARTNTRLS